MAMMAPTGLLDSFVAAIQASMSVLLVIFYGGIAARLNLLNPASTKAISKVCVRMFLPALLFTKIGSELHAGSAYLYLVILVWAIICHLISFLVGIAAHFLLGMPDWTTVAIMFNNTTSYPLLLAAALDQTGILSSLVVGDETSRQALERAKSYFLVFATVSSCLTFAVGPRLIDSEHAPEPDEDETDEQKSGDLDTEEESHPSPLLSSTRSSGDAAPPDAEIGSPDDRDGATEETALLAPSTRSSTVRFADPFASSRHNSFFPSMRKPSIAPVSSGNHTTTNGEAARKAISSAARRASVVPRRTWARLGPRTRWWLLFVSDFFNAPLLGALLGAVVGLVPALHRAFFADTPDGGIFTAWLTASFESIGGLFVPLPVVVAGVSLYTAVQETRKAARRGRGGGENAGSSSGSGVGSRLPWGTVVFILVVRFVVWPVVSIAAVYALASRTQTLGSDPMLWFAMMLMPTGPPAMKLITLVQVSDADEEEERNIAKLLTISYLISPVLSFTVVGSLRASQASIG